MDKHTTIYNLTMKFIEYGIDEEKAYELAVKSEEIMEQGILETVEKINQLLDYIVVKKTKDGEQNGWFKKI